jgi:plastocyanin
MRRPTTTAVAALISGLSLTAGILAFSGGVSAAETVPAEIKGYAYTPEDITVAVGDTVTWKNSDSAPHTVTSTSGKTLDSPNMAQGDTWSYTFTQPGTYPFYCAIHPDMKGTVTVTGTAAPATTTTMAGHSMDTTTTTAATGTTTPSTAAPTSAGVVAPFWVHFEKAHLETSPGDQVAQALSLDQYVKTHTVLVEDILSPIVGDC